MVKSFCPVLREALQKPRGNNHSKFMKSMRESQSLEKVNSFTFQWLLSMTKTRLRVSVVLKVTGGGLGRREGGRETEREREMG